MITYSMPIIHNFLNDLRMLLHIIANAKKSSLGIMPFKIFNYKLSWAGDRAIIEGEIDDFFLRGYSPQ